MKELPGPNTYHKDKQNLPGSHPIKSTDRKNTPHLDTTRVPRTQPPHHKKHPSNHVRKPIPGSRSSTIHSYIHILQTNPGSLLLQIYEGRRALHTRKPLQSHTYTTAQQNCPSTKQNTQRPYPDLTYVPGSRTLPSARMNTTYKHLRNG